MLGSGASGPLNGFEASSTAIFTTVSAENGTGWPSGSAAAGDEPDGASEAASAPPTASCKNSRRCLSAIVFFVRSPPNRTAHGPRRRRFPAKMISQPRRRKPRRKPGAFRPRRVGCISFFAAQRDAFCPRGETRSIARGVAAGNCGRPGRYCASPTDPASDLALPNLASRTAP